MRHRRAWGCVLVLLGALLAGCRPAGRFEVRPTKPAAPPATAPADAAAPP
jgi:hypothetical protein